MKPRNPPPEQDDLLRTRLVEMIDMRHELVKLAALIDWEVFEREWAGFFPSQTRRGPVADRSPSHADAPGRGALLPPARLPAIR